MVAPDPADYLRSALGALPWGVAVFGSDYTLVGHNQRFLDVFDFPARLQADGVPYRFLLKHAVQNGQFSNAEDAQLDEHSVVRNRMARLDSRENTTEEYEHSSGRAVKMQHVFQPNGGFVMLCSEISDGDAWFAEMVQHDALTGLNNRIHFRNLTDDAIRRGGTGVLYVVKVDSAGEVNKFVGRGQGDRVIRTVADRLTALAQPSGEVGRFGDNEFGLLMLGLDDETDIIVFAEKITEALQGAPITVTDTMEVDVNVSIASARFPADSREALELIQCAELAMSHASSEGGNRSRHFPFKTQMTEAAEQQGKITNDLRYAIERNELRCYYQPKVDLKTGRITGMEALIRWQHGKRGLIGPGLFIPVAERTGLIAPISEWITREACRQTKDWIDRGIADLKVAVNLSTVQFIRQSVVGTIMAALDDTGLDPDHLEIEITEGVLLHDDEVVTETFSWLRALGIPIAIDDFGTGYSSLAYLKRFAVDKVKIDASFVRNLHQDQDDAAIARAVISLAHSLNMKVVGEGIEEMEHALFLRNEGCDEGQGYLFGKPMPAAEFEKLLLTTPVFDLRAKDE